jgi:hypothetical protein
MDGGTDLAQAVLGLFQPDRGLWVAPVRHHSPACAWALQALIRAVSPTHVLVEGPADFDRHIDHILDPGTRPPVAIIALTQVDEAGTLRTASHYPLSGHSPEYVALQAGRAAGATLRFIDLDSGAFPDSPTPAVARPLQDDRPFTGGAYVEALCRATGARDGHDLWDQLFETRLGTSDWQGFFRDVGTYAAALRQAMPPDALTLQREAAMAGHVRAALGPGHRVVVVVGGYHAPVLCDPDTPPAAQAPPARGAASYLVRYGFAALDALGGYAAGLPLPGYYDRLWVEAQATGATPAFGGTALALLTGHAEVLRAAGHPHPLPALVEALRLADGLARLRGRPGPLRQDLLDGAATALVKGEASDRALWTADFARHLCGDRLGQVCRAAGLPPLVADAEARARALRFAVTDSTPRERKLEVRRKPAHRAASAFLHAMAILDTGFARMIVGPDYLAAPDPARLHETWSFGWSARVEARLIEAAPFGDTLPAACAARLTQDYDAIEAEARRGDLPLRCRLLLRGLLAGLGPALQPLARRLGGDLAAAPDLAALSEALRLLNLVAQTRGPLRAPEGLGLPRLVAAAYDRLVGLVDTLAGLPAADLPAAIDALRLVAGLLAGPGGAALDAGRFAAALDRLARARPPPALLGAALGLGVQAGQHPEGELAAAVTGGLVGMDLGEGRAAFLTGVLRAAPALLCRNGPLMDAVDRHLAELDEPAFLDLLPELRLAFSALSRQETARLAAHVARRHGLSEATPDPGDAAALRDVLDDLVAQGLGGWLVLADGGAA